MKERVLSSEEQAFLFVFFLFVFVFIFLAAL